MITKHVPPIPVLFFTARTSLKEIGQFVGIVARQLYAEAAKQELLPTGPLQWVYIGADGKPDTVFALEIALPVDGIPKESSVFLHKQLPPFDCVSVLHHGAWDHLYETYDRVIDEIGSQGKKMTGFCREQYIYMDFDKPENNITEVQMEVSS
jgi:effector-binding domain-containing protein